MEFADIYFLIGSLIGVVFSISFLVYYQVYEISNIDSVEAFLTKCFLFAFSIIIWPALIVAAFIWFSSRFIANKIKGLRYD